MNPIIKKLHQAIASDTWTILKENKAMIAGGTFERLIRDEKVNDFDIYFRSAEDVYNAVQDFKSNNYFIVSKTKRSFLLRSKDDETPINIIYMKYFQNVDEVLKLFDYECCKAGFDFVDNSFVTSPLFWESIATKKLIYANSLYPIGALIRLTKYINRGYTPDYASTLRLYRDLRTIDITNTDVLEDQIGGLYGCTIDLKGLNLDQMIEKIDNTVDYEKRPEAVSYEDIEKTFEHIFTSRALYFDSQTFVVTICGGKIINLRGCYPSDIEGMDELEFPIVLGKFIVKRDGKYYSNFNGQFEYKVGEIVKPLNPTSYGAGIYVATSNQLNLSITHSEQRRLASIEVESIKDIKKIESASQIVLHKGKVISIQD